jgi:NAD-dependent SIR2 family protein deacetylase
VLKPDVVYFGENVPAARVAAAYELVDASSALLVLGTSLTVFSGRRFVLRAAKAGVPVAIVNEGPTRGDEHAALKLETPIGATMTSLLRTVQDAAA